MRRVPRRLTTVGCCVFAALVSLLTMSALLGRISGIEDSGRVQP